MNSFAIAATELRAVHTQLNVIGDNVANATTRGYDARSVQLVSMNPGVKVGAIITSPGAGVDLVTQFAGLMMAQVAYRAALKVVSTSDQMAQALFASV